MVAFNNELSLTSSSPHLDHADACRLADQAVATLSRINARMIIIDLQHTREATTAAFARLVLLRRTLLEAGRDLRLIGLRDRAFSLYTINRLAEILPSR